MTNDVKRWQRYIELAPRKTFTQEEYNEWQDGTLHGAVEACRIALAAAEWREFYESMEAPRPYEAAWSITLLDAILQGNGPGE